MDGREEVRLADDGRDLGAALAAAVATLPAGVYQERSEKAAVRQTIVDDAKRSAGHRLVPPTHVSATSHTLAGERHVVPAEANKFNGQTLLMPVQRSTTSQPPLTARQGVMLEASKSAGHAAAVPVQSSWASHGDDEDRQILELRFDLFD